MGSEASSHPPRKTRWTDPSSPLPTRQNPVGLRRLQRQGSWSPESASEGNGEGGGDARGREFKKRALAASGQILQLVTCVLGEGVNPHVPDFSETLLSGSLDYDKVAWGLIITPSHHLNYGNNCCNSLPHLRYPNLEEFYPTPNT